MSESVSASEIYSHDGVKDSLTHLAAPPYFYENLRREIVSSVRSGKPIVVLKFILRSTGLEKRESILNFADHLSNNFRQGDLLARMGRFEFMALISASNEYVPQIIQRIAGTGNFEFEYSIASSVDHDDALKLLNRLDESEIYFA